MPRYVLVYTRKSKKPSIGKVVTYDKKGVIGIFHRKAPLTKELRENMLVVAKILAREAGKQNFYILWPVKIIDADEGIPSEYDRNLEVWGRPAYKALKRIKMMRREARSK